MREVSKSEPIRYRKVTEQLSRMTKESNLEKCVIRSMRRFPNQPARSKTKFGLNGEQELILEPSRFNVSDVYEASLLVHRILGDYIMPSKVGTYSHYSKIISKLYGLAQTRIINTL